MLNASAALVVRLLFGMLKARRKLCYVLGLRQRALPVCQEEIGKVLQKAPLTAVDVGGAVDLQPHWYKLLGNAHLHVFEPHPEAYADLLRKRESMPAKELYHAHNAALSGRGGTRTLYLTNVPTSSTIAKLNPESAYYETNKPFFFPMKELPLETVTLEQALNGAPAPVDLVKLDIQGAELEVLEGLGAAKLATLLCFEMEVHLQDTYIDGTTLKDVAAFVEKNGFELLDVKVARDYVQRQNRTEFAKTNLAIDGWKASVSAKSWEFDIVCFRKPEPLLARKDAAALRRLIACYMVYNFFAEALCLAEEAKERGIFSAADTSSVSGSIRNAEAALAFEVEPWETIQKGTGSQAWAQYLWLGFPST